MYGTTSAYTWKKMADQFPQSSGYALFQNDVMSSINIDDTIQGYLGDCWVLSTIAAAAEKPERVWRMFDTKTYNSAGIYSIRFYELGVPISVVIDDYLPISGTQNLFVKANTPQKETWPLLIEKAFSKIHGNFKAIEGGWMVDAGNTMLGTGGSSINVTTSTVDVVWTTALDWDTKGYVMTAATSASLDGIIGGHAYTFIGAYTLSNGAKVFKLRNPWGSSEWTGAYADTDVYWTNNPADATLVGFVNKNDGDFIMTVADFQTHFSSLAFNYDPTGW
jgi:calpain-15